MNIKILSCVSFVLIPLLFTSCEDGSHSARGLDFSFKDKGSLTYTVKYDGNGSTSGTVPTDSNNYEEGAIITVASVGDIIKTGKTFSGWNTVADGSGTAVTSGSTFTIGTTDVTLYAQWKNPIIGYEGSQGGASLVIGQAYQGGKVAYILGPEDSGYSATVQHGLIVAITNQSTKAQWGCVGTLIMTPTSMTETIEIGTGQANTTAIINGCSSSAGKDDLAAKICNDYTNSDTGTGVYSDWYLPNLAELLALYSNRAVIGGFVEHDYWSSSEANDNEAWYVKFYDTNTSNESNNYKNVTKCVRAVRSF